LPIRRLSWCASTLASLLLSPAAAAQDRATASSPPTAADSASTAPTSDWSLGAGLRFGGIAMGAGVMPIGSLATATLTVEHRLGDALWLMTGVQGGYGRSSLTTSAGGYRYDHDSESFLFGGEVGPRWVLTPGATFELSAFALFTVSHQRIDSGAALPQAPTYQTDVGARAGLALDHQLTEGLALRLGTTLLSVGYLTGEQYGAALQSGIGGLTAETTSVRGFHGSASLSPGLQLRFTL